MPDWDESTEVAVLTQTTLSVDDTRRSVEAVQERFSNVVVRNDLCYATTNRQAAVKELCEQVEVVLVVGASNSSNCMRLREVAEAHGKSRPTWWAGRRSWTSIGWRASSPWA